MNEIWIVEAWDYDTTIVKGYFLNQEEAKEYCNIMTRVDEYFGYRYYKQKLLNIKEVRRKINNLYSISFDNWKIDEDATDERETFWQNPPYITYWYEDEEEEVIGLDFEIIADNKDEAIKIAFDRMYQIKKKYEELNDLNKACEFFTNEEE